MTMGELPDGFELLRPALTLFSGLSIPWWLTGGWAIDLVAGSVSRPHHGIDFFVVQEDASALTTQLVGVTFVLGNHPEAWSPGARPLATGDHLFVDSPELPIRTQVAFGERDGDDWILQHNPTIRIPVGEAEATTSGIRQLTLSVILFLRAFSFRPQDQQDFETALPLLDTRERSWLIGALELHRSGLKSDDEALSHPWLSALQGR